MPPFAALKIWMISVFSGVLILSKVVETWTCSSRPNVHSRTISAESEREQVRPDRRLSEPEHLQLRHIRHSSGEEELVELSEQRAALLLDDVSGVHADYAEVACYNGSQPVGATNGIRLDEEFHTAGRDEPSVQGGIIQHYQHADLRRCQHKQSRPRLCAPTWQIPMNPARGPVTAPSVPGRRTFPRPVQLSLKMQF